MTVLNGRIWLFRTILGLIVSAGLLAYVCWSLYTIHGVRDAEIIDEQQYTQSKISEQDMKLICYFDVHWNRSLDNLLLKDVDPHLCTHINVGPFTVENSTITMTNELQRVLREELPFLKSLNSNLKILLWIGGGGSTGFSEMVKDHAHRKTFIRSCVHVLRNFSMNGIDLDWEFPSAYDKERQHFSQLLYETRKKFDSIYHNKWQYLISVAAAAPEGISFFAYDVREINKYADYVNLMAYDFHFYSKAAPFTGLNAPLYARSNEANLLTTLNINYTMNWWLSKGLERSKLIVGLPTYGHSFRLVNALNSKIGAPSRSIGRCGIDGFTTYSDICRFTSENPSTIVFDNQSCSPFLHSGTEWISFENEQSLECKANFVKSEKLGGVMVFSLNTDDIGQTCNGAVPFPLIAKVKSTIQLN